VPKAIGLISDTHGLVRNEVFDALAGVEMILHAGDVGGRDVLLALEAIAPVRAVYGNTDRIGDPELDQEVDLVQHGVRIHVSHGHELGSPTVAKLLAAYSAQVIVYGHTHVAHVEEVEGRLVVNPGSAGPRRFNLQPSVGRLRIVNGRPLVDIIAL
jgi:uncharacterized protein